MNALALLTIAIATSQAPDLAELQRRVRADSNDAVLHYDVGVELLRRKQADEARRAFRHAALIDPQFLDAWIGLYRLTPRSEHGSFVFAYDPQRRRLVFEMLPAKDTVRRMSRRIFYLDPLVDLDNATRYPEPTVWAGTLSQAMRAYRKGNWELASAWFDTIIVKSVQRKKPVPPIAVWYQSLAQLELGNAEGAVRGLQRLLDAQRTDSTPSGKTASFRLEYALGHVHHRAGHHADAARIYRSLVDSQLGLDIVHARLASALEAQGLQAEAVAERRNAVNANPDDPSLGFDLGVTLVKAGEYAEAATVLKRALDANPREARAHFVLGVALESQGETTAAREAYERFLAIAPQRLTEQRESARMRLAGLP